jgi:hypothetical protein
VVPDRHRFAQTRVAAKNSRLSTAEAILADYYQHIMTHNVALRSRWELGYTEQQAVRMLHRAPELRDPCKLVVEI